MSSLHNFPSLKINSIHYTLFTPEFAMIIIIKLSNIFSGLLCLLQRTSQLCVCKFITTEGQATAFLTNQL